MLHIAKSYQTRHPALFHHSRVYFRESHPASFQSNAVFSSPRGRRLDHG